MGAPIKQNLKHDEVEQFANSESESDPGSGELNILVSIPESIEIKMVDATVLADYEIYLFIASACLSFFSGFIVSYIQATDSKQSTILGVCSLIFLLLSIAFIIMAFVKRCILKKKCKLVKLKTSRVVSQRDM